MIASKGQWTNCSACKSGYEQLSQFSIHEPRVCLGKPLETQSGRALTFSSYGGERIRTASLPRARRALSQLELHPRDGSRASL